MNGALLIVVFSIVFFCQLVEPFVHEILNRIPYKKGSKMQRCSSGNLRITPLFHLTSPWSSQHRLHGWKVVVYLFFNPTNKYVKNYINRIICISRICTREVIDSDKMLKPLGERLLG